MSRRQDSQHTITPEMVLRAYSIGIFPMAESAEDPSLHWVEPQKRGIIPLDSLYISKSLAKLVRSDRFSIEIDSDFNAVIEACATTHGSTWINSRIRELFGELFDLGYVHTVEVYEQGKLVGGLYGLALGGAFFGESMFHTARDASKVALVHLVARLNAGGFTILDAQFITPHLASLGAIEIDRSEYQKRLAHAINTEGDFGLWPKTKPRSGREALQVIDQFRKVIPKQPEAC